MNNSKSIKILSAIIVVTLFLIFILWCTEKMGDIGSILSGIGTLGLLFAAIWQIPIELEKNRNQRHKERVTDIAFDLGEDTIHFIDSIKGLISPLSFKHEILEEDKRETEGKNDRYKNLSKIYRYRQKQYEKRIEKFYEASWKVRYFKNSDVLEEKIEILKKILWDLSVKIYSLHNCDDDDTTNAKHFYDEFYKVTTNEKLLLLEKEILDLLAKNFD